MSKENIGKKFTEVIKDDYKDWKKGDVICLNGATGSGKTYFVEHVLAKYARNNLRGILFLCNRRELADVVQFEIQQLGLEHVIDVDTYQNLQNKINKGEDLKGFYSYVVYDEAHYLTTEGWNSNTDRMWNFFQSNEEKYIHIFMSGTGCNIFTYLKNKYVDRKEYIIPYSYDYVTKLTFYEDDEKVEELFNNLKDDEKLIYFCNKLDRAKELHEKYKDKASFKCSKYCRYKDLDEDCIKTYNKDLITFDKQILITTAVLDVGITLKDKSIKYIVTDLVNINQLQQCLGRKRTVDKTDTCEFYIKNYNKNTLNGHMATMENTILKDAHEYYKNREEFIKEKDIERKIKDNPCFLYKKPDDIDETKENNSIMGNYVFNYFTYMYYKVAYCDFKIEKECGFATHVLNRLGDTIKNVEYVKYIEEENKKKSLEEYLEDMFQNKVVLLEKKDRKELIEEINLIDGKHSCIKKNEIKYVQKIKTLNTFLLEDLKSNYQIKEFETSNIIEGKKKNFKHAWKIIKIIDNIE